jgi:hypothetical protein
MDFFLVAPSMCQARNLTSQLLLSLITQRVFIAETLVWVRFGKVVY